MQRMRNKKSSTPVAILILVFLTASLISYSLAVFLISKGSSDRHTFSFLVLEKVYAKEQLINLYLSEGVSLREAVSLTGAGLEGRVVIVKEKFEDKDDKVEIEYKFVPSEKLE